jgi:dolichol-phosphate mannosyltransferase
MHRPYFSVVLPVFNEEGNLSELHARLTKVLTEDIARSYELIFVDDGSADGTFTRLTELHTRDPHVRVLRFARNFGHHLAITAGIDAARGDVVALMDSDLQDLPESLPLLHAKLEEGYDVVRAVRQGKKHSLFKRVTSDLFNRLMNRLVAGFEIDTAVFRIARRPVIDAVKACREQARFILGLFSWVGFRQTSVEVPHGERHTGETKYSLFKMIRLAVNTITAFSRMPLQVASYIGLLIALCSFGFGSWIIAKKVFLDTAVEGWSSLIVVILFLGGVQLLCLGILGEYVGRAYSEVQKRPLYVVSTELDGATAADDGAAAEGPASGVEASGGAGIAPVRAGARTGATPGSIS